MVGLDAAGKTTILYKLKLGEIVTTIPTIGNYFFDLSKMATIFYKEVAKVAILHKPVSYLILRKFIFDVKGALRDSQKKINWNNHVAPYHLSFLRPFCT